MLAALEEALACPFWADGFFLRTLDRVVSNFHLSRCFCARYSSGCEGSFAGQKSHMPGATLVSKGQRPQLRGRLTLEPLPAPILPGRWDRAEVELCYLLLPRPILASNEQVGRAWNDG